MNYSIKHYLSKPLSESTMSKFLILREKYRLMTTDTDIITIKVIAKFVKDIEGMRYMFFPNAGISLDKTH